MIPADPRRNSSPSTSLIKNALARKNSLVELRFRMKRIDDSLQKRIAGYDNEIPEQLHVDDDNLSRPCKLDRIITD